MVVHLNYTYTHNIWKYYRNCGNYAVLLDCNTSQTFSQPQISKIPLDLVVSEVPHRVK